MTVIQEFDIDDKLYTVEAYIVPEEACTYDYLGSPATVDIFTVYDEQGCEITSAIDYTLYWDLEDKILDYYHTIQ